MGTPRHRSIRTHGHGLVPGLPRLLGGRLCLDFANTVEDRLGERPLDILAGYDELVRWGRHVGELTEGEGEALLRRAARRPAAANAALARAIAVREAIYRVFAAGAGGETPPAPDLESVRAAYLAALGAARLAPRPGGVGWVWPAVDEAGEADGVFDRVLWPVARSAVELLTGPELGRVKTCAGPEGCGWLFLDASRNNSRRWCSMEGCGSRAKMRRHYARAKA